MIAAAANPPGDAASLKPFLAQLAQGRTLDEAEAGRAFEIIMSGAATPAQIGAFLMGLHLRGETVAEITGAARVMRAKVTGVQAPPGAVDCCGTGGDGAHSYNISTAVSFVLAGSGVPVAKHGNRARSSKTGAADVLAELGVNIEAEVPVIERAIRRVNIGFLFAQKHHGAMRHVGPARVELGFSTIFNVLGPLTNPAGARRQLLGVNDPAWLAPLAEVLGKLGSEAAWVVHGTDGMDEITITGPSRIAQLRDGRVTEFQIAPEDLGLARADADAIRGGDAATNAAALRRVLAGEPSAYRDIVVLNAAAALVVADRVGNLAEGVELAQAVLDGGKAQAALDGLIRISNESPVE